MKSITIIILFLCMVSGCSSSEEPQVTDPDEVQLEFSNIGEFPSSGRTGAFSFTIGNKIYVGTGYGSNATYYGDFWEYDINSATWKEKASFPLGPFIGGEVLVYNEKGYVFVGGTLSCPELNVACDHIEYTAVHAYDPVSDSWEKVADLPAFRGMNYGDIEVNGDKAILFWGRKTYEISLIDFQFIQKTSAPASIVYSANFRVGNKVYFTCRMDSGKGTKSNYSYDLVTDQWEVLPDFPGIKRYDATGFAQNGFGYILGGKESDYQGEEEQFKEIWQFNPAEESWKMVGEYPGNAYTGQVLEIVGNDIFIGFGDTRSYITFEKDWWRLKIN
ncbi:kelch repeat-containing protein [Algoriphagus sp. Y33]|uniref:Kelch repeat-containing protein n=1 Tax=Algoriphagus sp. Y33 TaxID=2772483 RepID=UPI0017813431|nr:kelch repeat-containing protein [Algoriphagus sp. Y33]